MPLPEALRGDRWTQETARKVFPLLVWCAENGRTITYSKLDQEIVSRGWGDHVMYVQYGQPAGAVGDALLETEKKWRVRIPPLNALIVNEKTGVPGKGCDYYLRHFLRGKKKPLSKADRKALAEATHEKIFNFRHWHRILREYNFKPLSKGPTAAPAKSVSKPVHHGWSNEGESEEHDVLKHIIANNPGMLGLDVKLPKGDCEHVLASADRPDVMFVGKLLTVAVEAKSSLSNDIDLQRGVFQCVKYRALIRAEQKARKEVPNGLAILATERALPPPILELADLLDVPVAVIKKKQA